jgi:Wntless-like, transmembrane domain
MIPLDDDENLIDNMQYESSSDDGGNRIDEISLSSSETSLHRANQIVVVDSQRNKNVRNSRNKSMALVVDSDDDGHVASNFDGNDSDNGDNGNNANSSKYNLGIHEKSRNEKFNDDDDDDDVEVGHNMQDGGSDDESGGVHELDNALGKLDRRSNRMLLQHLSARGFALAFGAFFALLAVAIVVGIFGPAVYTEKSVYTWNCPYDTVGVDSGYSYQCAGRDLGRGETWRGEVYGLDELNRELVLMATPTNLLEASEGVIKKVEWTISMWKGTKSAKEDATLASDEWTAVVLDDTKSTEVWCSDGVYYCESVALIHEPFVDAYAYRFDVKVSFPRNDPSSTPPAESNWLGDVRMEFRVVNNAYTTFEVAWRFTFLLVSLGIGAYFTWRLREFHWRTWTIEQRWTCLLLAGVIAYNNPLYPLSVIVDSWLPAFLGQVFAVTFVGELLFFWLVTFDGLRKEEPGKRLFARFYLPKLLFILVWWLCTLVISVWIEVHELDNPEYTDVRDIPGFIFFSIFELAAVLIYIVWFVWIVLNAFRDMRTLPLLSSRVKFLGALTFFVIALTVFGVLFDLLKPDVGSAAAFLLYIALFNLYVWLLAVVYSPAAYETIGGAANLAQYEIAAWDDDTQRSIDLDDGDDDDDDYSAPPLTIVAGTPRQSVRLRETLDEDDDDIALYDI